MRVKALRGVCIGIDRHLAVGDTEDLEAGLVTYLVNIGAVERIADPVVEKPIVKPTPEKSGKQEK